MFKYLNVRNLNIQLFFFYAIFSRDLLIELRFLVLHLIAATIWVGGHMLLLICYVPTAVKQKDKYIILNFEKKYEKLGMTALAILVTTGIGMATDYGIMPSEWLDFKDPIERVVSSKLVLLFLTLSLALSAQLNVIPRLKADNNYLLPLIYHIAFVTAIGISMLIVGTFVRFGGI